MRAMTVSSFPPKCRHSNLVSEPRDVAGIPTLVTVDGLSRWSESEGGAEPRPTIRSGAFLA